MTTFPTLIFVAVVVILIVVSGYMLLRKRTDEPREDNYIRGLEYWLEGDLPAAIRSMKAAAQTDRRSVEPYLQLGNLLRISGDPARAANIHRSLTVRPRLSRGQILAINLSLVDDLLALSDWEEAGRLLEQLDKSARRSERFWRARFRQYDRIGQPSSAARTLKDAARHLGGTEGAVFAERYELYQLDRAMRAATSQKPGEARRLLNSVSSETGRQDLVHFISATASLADGDVEGAAETATEGILKYPELSELLLPVLQKSLLESGRFGRAIPILESAVRKPGAPISLLMTLALLYEKVGDRELALDLISGRSGDPDLTPDAAAPYLRILIHDLPDCDFSRIWAALHLPESDKSTACPACGARAEHVGWYCGACGAFSGDPVPHGGETVS